MSKKHIGSSFEDFLMEDAEFLCGRTFARRLPKLQRIDAASEPTNLLSPALSALMDFYEGIGDLAGDESEVELMIQLSGMTGANVFAMDDE